jgi:hypothetical protein
LEFTFVASRSLCKDVQDQLTSIDNPNLECRFQIALLSGTQLPVKNNHIWLCLRNRPLNLQNLSDTDQGPGVDRFQALDKRTNDPRTVGFGQPFQFL